MPQARHICNVYVMRNPPKQLRSTTLNETAVGVLVSEAFKDRMRAPAYLGAAERVLKNILNPAFVAEYKKRIAFYRNQFSQSIRQEVKKQKKIPERLALPHIEELPQVPA